MNISRFAYRILRIHIVLTIFLVFRPIGATIVSGDQSDSHASSGGTLRNRSRVIERFRQNTADL